MGNIFAPEKFLLPILDESCFRYDCCEEREQTTHDDEKCIECCVNCQKYKDWMFPYAPNHPKWAQCNCMPYECALCSPLICITCKKVGITTGGSCSAVVNKTYLIYMCTACARKSDMNHKEHITFVSRKQLKYQSELTKVMYVYFLPDISNYILEYCGAFEFWKYMGFTF